MNKIILAIVVALIASVIGYILFYWPFLGIVAVSLIGAALGLAIVSAFQKPDTPPPSNFAKFLGALAVALVLLFIIVQFVPNRGGQKSVQVTIDCSSNQYNVNDIEVFQGGTVSWKLSGTAQTKVTIHSFRLKYLFFKVHPIVNADIPKLEGFVPDPIGPVQVRDDLNILKRHFKYSYTCAPPSGAPFKVDPMFYVPK
jgi:uncharacterized membrane protein YeaQ/YmgE (transglycosylase-associated protein family)